MVGEDYPEPDIMWNRYGTTSGSYPDLDRFNRVTSSRWTTDLTPTDVDFYDIDITYDRNSNITLIEDNVHSGFDVEYTNDNLNRLTQAEEGTWNSGTSQIDSRTRNQVWTLDQVGNWDIGKLDIDGDNNYNETNEYNDDRTHNVVNELTARDTDDNGTDDYTLTYDAVGNLTDDGENYEYVYDVFGRLRKINDESDQSLVAEYRYNGLGYKISQHQDTDTDGDVDANDKWFHGVYDTNWRMVAIFRDDDTDPKEQFVHHNAGEDGLGGSSYIDRVILRDRDNTNGPTGAPDGTLEERRYYCQNWRHDVSAVVTSGGVLVEWGKYSSYGVPFGLPGADTDSDGDCDSTDITQIQTWINASTYDVRADLDLDGDVDSTDKTNAQNNYQGSTLGWHVLSGVRRQHGYAGYEWDAAASKYHVRYRVFDSHLGRWTRRDPLGYVDGESLVEYVGSFPLVSQDPTGLAHGSPGLLLYARAVSWCCEEACRRAAAYARSIGGEPPFGTGVCCFGNPFVCVCVDHLREYGKSYRFNPPVDWDGLSPNEQRQFRDCIAAHEKRLQGSWCCHPYEEGDSPIRPPAWCDWQDCAECKSQRQAVECIRSIACEDVPCLMLKQQMIQDLDDMADDWCSKCDEHDGEEFPNPAECCKGPETDDGQPKL